MCEDGKLGAFWKKLERPKREDSVRQKGGWTTPRAVMLKVTAKDQRRSGDWIPLTTRREPWDRE